MVCVKKRKENRSRKLMLLYMVKIVNLVKTNESSSLEHVLYIVFTVYCSLM
jgi:hypothetical protein